MWVLCRPLLGFCSRPCFYRRFWIPDDADTDACTTFTAQTRLRLSRLYYTFELSIPHILSRFRAIPSSSSMHITFFFSPEATCESLSWFLVFMKKTTRSLCLHMLIVCDHGVCL